MSIVLVFTNIFDVQANLMQMHNLRAILKTSRLMAHGNYLLFADHQVRTSGGPETLLTERLRKVSR